MAKADLMRELAEQIELEEKSEKCEKIEPLLYNAIGYMIETRMNNSELSNKELCEEIAEYLGCEVTELIELGALEEELYK